MFQQKKPSRLLKKTTCHAESFGLAQDTLREASAVTSRKQTKQILRFAQGRSRAEGERDQDDGRRVVFQQPARLANSQAGNDQVTVSSLSSGLNDALADGIAN